MTEKLTPAEIEFKSYTDLLIGQAVIDIGDGKNPYDSIRNVIIETLKWLHSKEEVNDR